MGKGDKYVHPADAFRKEMKKKVECQICKAISKQALIYVAGTKA
jgi:hypothetical protein